MLVAMEHPIAKYKISLIPGLSISNRDLVLGGIFVFVWPTFLLLFVSIVQLQLGIFAVEVISHAALRIYPVFALAYAIILLLQRLFPDALSEGKFWRQLVLHFAALFFAGQFFDPVIAQTATPDIPRPKIVPLVLIFCQIALYVLIKTYIIQRERHLSTQLNLQQAQVNLLRSQSNPHFLFNTLNLLASEISKNPDNARDIVYDLADLLRESIKAGESEFIRFEEELRLARLYLTLQKQRFPERLDFEINVDDSCLTARVPSLMLQPVVENVIKHVVARSTSKITLVLSATVSDDTLICCVQDNGPEIDADNIEISGGLRIVKETLALHYQGKAGIGFESTTSGGSVTVFLPITQAQPGN